jgi:hypothetical protein
VWDWRLELWVLTLVTPSTGIGSHTKTQFCDDVTQGLKWSRSAKCVCVQSAWLPMPQQRGDFKEICIQLTTGFNNYSYSNNQGNEVPELPLSDDHRAQNINQRGFHLVLIKPVKVVVVVNHWQIHYLNPSKCTLILYVPVLSSLVV